MNLKLDNIKNIYDDLLHKINFMDITHCYDIKITQTKDIIIINFIHPNNITVLDHDMNIPVFNISLDLKKQTFLFGQPNIKNRSLSQGVLNTLNNKLYYSYVSPSIHVVPNITLEKIEYGNINFPNNAVLQYKLKHSKKSIEKRETAKIRFIMHTLFSDYMDVETRKLLTYYRVPFHFICDIKGLFKNILYDDYNIDNYEKYKKRLFQALTTYPALFRYIDINDKYRLVSDIYHGISLKNTLGQQYKTLRSVRTPIISKFNTDELNLIHMKKIRYIDLKFHNAVKDIIHKDYLKNNKNFIEFKNLFYKNFKINLKSKNQLKIRECVIQIKDSLRFLENRCHINIDNSFKLETLLEINKRFHEISHRILIPDNSGASSQDEIISIEQSRKIDLSDFEFSDFVSQLITPDDFYKEGHDLHHCVSGYYQSFMAKKCILFSINDGENRSTAEILLSFEIKNKKFKLVQHRSYRNREPMGQNNIIVKSLVSFLNKDIENFNKIKKSAIYRHNSRMVLNKELVIENLLQPLKLYKKSSLYTERDEQ